MIDSLQWYGNSTGIAYLIFPGEFHYAARSWNLSFGIVIHMIGPSKDHNHIAYSMEHAFPCPTGGYLTISYDEVLATLNAIRGLTQC